MKFIYSSRLDRSTPLLRAIGIGRAIPAQPHKSTHQ